jgi:hypothetical protein
MPGKLPQLVGVLAMALAVSGCCRKHQIKPPIQIVQTDRSCAESWEDPPQYPDPAWAGSEEGCPSSFEACIDLDNADRLGEYLEAVAAWVETAEATCTKTKDRRP